MMQHRARAVGVGLIGSREGVSGLNASRLRMG